MSPYVERFVERLRDAEDDLKRQVDEQQRRWHYRVHRGRVWFDKELRESHRHLRQSIPAYILQGNLLSLLTAPVIYSSGRRIFGTLWGKFGALCEGRKADASAAAPHCRSRGRLASCCLVARYVCGRRSRGRRIGTHRAGARKLRVSNGTSPGDCGVRRRRKVQHETDHGDDGGDDVGAHAAAGGR